MNAFKIRRMTAVVCALLLLLGTLPGAYAAEQYALSVGSPDIHYTVTPGASVALDAADFRAFFYARCQNDTFRYVTFQSDSSLKASNGVLYCNYGTDNETAFTRNMLEETIFYDRSSMYGSYALDALSFVANRQADGETVTLSFTVCGDSDSAGGRLDIDIQGSAPQETSVVDITWHVTAGEVLRFDRNAFRDFFNDRASATDEGFRYATFAPDESFNPDNGHLYYDFEGKGHKEFNADMLRQTDFFYSSNRYGAYPLSGLTFLAANEGGGRLVRIPFTVFGRMERYSGTLVIQINWASVNNTPTPTTPTTPVITPTTPTTPVITPTTPTTPVITPTTPVTTPTEPVTTPTTPVTSAASDDVPEITYSVRAGSSVAFRLDDFNAVAGKNLKSTFRYATFSTGDTLSDTYGLLTVSVGGLEEMTFISTTVDDYRFYAASDSYGEYALGGLTFTAPAAAPAHTVHLSGVLHGSDKDTASVMVIITVEAQNPETETPTVPDTTQTPEVPDTTQTQTPEVPDTTQTPEVPDTTETPEVPDTTQTPEVPDTTETPEVPDTTQTQTPEVPQSPPLNITEPFTGTAVQTDNILYNTTWETPLRLVSDDFAHLFRRTFPGGTISHVSLSGVPQRGKLFYDYYATSPYGDADQMEIVSRSLAYSNFYFSPAYTDRYSLAELVYVPSESANYCESIPFAITGADANGETVQCAANLLISVTRAVITDVYGAIPVGRTVTFPASNIVSNIRTGTGAEVYGIRLLKLPDASAGTVRVGESDTPADVSTIYHWPEGTPSISDLHFVPAEAFTGSVDIPYVAIDADGQEMGIGHFNLGIISTLKRFSDVTSSVWCYKYVTELAAAGVVGGYSDNTYRPEVSVTWGAALKLIMLAAGYDEQLSPSSITPFQGYLDKALEDGLLPKEIDLWEPVTRLEVAELAAAAMKLDTSHLSSVEPFSDTDNLSVKALNAAGIINGYYVEGDSTFRPSGTLNRGQVAAIVWRMRNYKG